MKPRHWLRPGASVRLPRPEVRTTFKLVLPSGSRPMKAKLRTPGGPISSELPGGRLRKHPAARNECATGHLKPPIGRLLPVFPTVTKMTRVPSGDSTGAYIRLGRIRRETRPGHQWAIRSIPWCEARHLLRAQPVRNVDHRNPRLGGLPVRRQVLSDRRRHQSGPASYYPRVTWTTMS